MDEFGFLKLLKLLKKPREAINLQAGSLAGLYRKLPYLAAEIAIGDADREWREHVDMDG